MPSSVLKAVIKPDFFAHPEPWLPLQISVTLPPHHSPQSALGLSILSPLKKSQTVIPAPLCREVSPLPKNSESLFQFHLSDLPSIVLCSSSCLLLGAICISKPVTACVYIYTVSDFGKGGEGTGKREKSQLHCVRLRREIDTLA